MHTTSLSRIILVAAILLAVALALATGGGRVAAVAGPTSYVVAAGDTLSALSLRFGVSVADLARRNGIANPDRIRAGQELRLDLEASATVAAPAAPGSPAATAARPAGRAYAVRPGDTLGAIATAHGLSAEALAELNGLTNPHFIREGQLLRLPDPTPAPATPPAVTPGSGATAAAGATPTAAPARAAAAEAGAGLERSVRLAAAAAAATDPRLGIAALNPATGERLEIRADEVFHSASLLKVPILVELYRQRADARGRLPDDLRRLAEPMATISDNESANRLISLLGRDGVNATNRRLGLGATVLYNGFRDDAPVPASGYNQTTPRDMARLFEQLLAGRVVSPEASREIVATLARGVESRLARELPAGTRVAQKGGWYPGVSHEVGIVYAPRGPYVVAILAEGAFDDARGDRIIAAASRALYDAWGR